MTRSKLYVSLISTMYSRINLIHLTRLDDRRENDTLWHGELF